MLFDALVGGRTVRVEVRGRDGRFTVTLDKRPLEVDFVEAGRHFASLLIDGRSYEVGVLKRDGVYAVVLSGEAVEVRLQDASRSATGVSRPGGDGPASVVAPMPGRIVRVLARPGQEVKAGAGLVVMEAMKMENELRAPGPGRVTAIRVEAGQAVEKGEVLLEFEDLT
jgi:biotin carboxyl carrier protein